MRYLKDAHPLAQMVNRYGPAVDGGLSRIAAGLSSEAGVYDKGKPAGGTANVTSGRDELIALFEGEFHQILIEAGCAHISTVPHLQIDGDSAVGLGYTVLFIWRPGTGDFAIRRVMATCFDFERTNGEWRIARRTNRNLDGDVAARELFATSGSRVGPAPTSGR